MNSTRFDFSNILKRKCSHFQDSNQEGSLTLVFTMTLLIGLIVFGSLIMTNLIIAIIVTDVKKLANDAKEQVLFNKVTAAIYV